MGLGTTKKKRVVGTSIQRIIDLNDVTLAREFALKRALFYGQDIVSSMTNANANNIYAKYKKASKFAAKPGAYYYGKVSSGVIIEDDAAVSTYFNNYVDSLHSGAVVNYIKVGEVYNYHFMWHILKNLYGYTLANNELTSLSAFIGKPCYLVDCDIRYCDNTIENSLNDEFLAPIGLAFKHGYTHTRARDYSRTHNEYQVENTIGNDYYVVYYQTKFVKTVVEVKDLATNTIVTTTTYDGTTPTVFDNMDETLTNTDVVTTATEETTTKTYDQLYYLSVLDDFLLYEQSGDFDESIVLDEDDTENIDPDAVDTSSTGVLTKQYYMVQYSYEVSGTTYYDWYTYEIGSGTNPTLDTLLEDGLDTANFLPRMYLRSNGLKLNLNKTEEKYKESKKLARILGIDYSDLIDTVHENIGSLEKVKQISLNLQVALNDCTNAQALYLTKYFMYYHSLLDTASPASVGTSGSAVLETNFLTTYSSYNLKRGKLIEYRDNLFKQSFNVGHVGYKTITGSIGEVNHSTVSYEDTSVTVSVYEAVFVFGGSGGSYRYNTYNKRSIILRWQNTETTYIELVLFDPSSSDLIHGNLSSSADCFSDNLVVPVDLNVLSTLTGKYRELVALHSFYLHITASYIVKVKWYQREAFGIFLTALAIVVAVFNAPAGGAVVKIAAAAKALIIAQTFKLGIKLTVKIFDLDEDVELILNAIAAVYTLDFSNLKTTLDTAIAVLNSVNVVMGIYSEYQNNEYLEVLRQYSEWAESASTQLELLEEAKDLIKQPKYIYDPLYSPTNQLNSFYIRLGQSPNAYLTTYTGQTNPGVLTLSYPSVYVSSKLTLPDLGGFTV